jgi:hypothetical protein
LKELEAVLTQFAPRSGQKLETCLKALKYALKSDDTKALLERLERQKQTFELALVTLSTYYPSLKRWSQFIGTYIFTNRMLRMKNGRGHKTSGKATKPSVNVSSQIRLPLNPILVQTTKDILEWLYPGSFAERHQYLVSLRVENTGQWFVEDRKFNEWVSGSDRPLLYCPGIGTLHFQSR